MRTLQRHTVEAGLDLVVLDRPERLNALDHTMISELHALFDDLEADLSTRVVILTGSGRAFCAGMDLKDVDSYELDGSIGNSLRTQAHWAATVGRLRQLPQPVIAAVNGPAAGGGFALTLGADIRVAARSARFNVANVKIGLSAGDFGISWLLPRLIGASRAFELLYTGRAVDGEEAERIGLASSVVDDEAVVDRACEIGRQIVANGPFGIRMTKELAWTQLEIGTLEAALHLENRTQVLASRTGALEEAMVAFVEKRAPDWAPDM